MTTALAAILNRNFDDTLTMLERALSACPNDLWETDLWPDEAPTEPGPHGGLHGSAPWFLAYHALSCCDYDLTGGYGVWLPPPAFRDHVWGAPSRAHTKAELLGWVEVCRGRVRDTLASLTEDAAMRPLPDTHRHHPTPYGVMIGTIPQHVTEHAVQIRAFIAAAGAA